MPEQNPNQQHAHAAHAAKKQAADARRKDAERQADEGAKVKQAAVDAHEERTANAQPTPTQREVDLAKLGVPVTEKEDDGSGEDLAMVRSVQPVQSGAAPYNTRDAGAASQPQRQPPRDPNRAEQNKASGENK